MMIFGFLPQNVKTQAVAVAFSIAWLEAGVEPQPEDARARERLMGFRRELYRCFTARADVLFELAEAVLCAGGPVKTLAGLSLAPEHRRGHGALYDAVNSGRVEIARLRRSLAGLPLPRAADGRLMLAVDVSNWLRPGAATSPERLFCHVYGRGKGQAQMIPGWPYSVVAALEPGRTSWTAVLDAVRLGPDDDEAEVTAAQVREVITRLIEAGHWHDGELPVLVIVDAGYDPMRLAHQLTDLPVEVLGRLRSDRVLHFPVPARQPGTNGRPPRHGRQFTLADPATWPGPAVTTTTATTRYGTAVAQAWDRLHPRLTHRSAWLIITCHAQLRLARPLAADLRLPWERPAPPGRLTPARVRRGFQNIRAALPCLAGAPKPGKPGPGRPPGSKNRRPAPRHDVGKTTKRDASLTARRERAG